MMREDFEAIGAEPGRMLAGLASAGANGEHVSNIERDVLRRSTPSQARSNPMLQPLIWSSIPRYY